MNCTQNISYLSSKNKLYCSGCGACAQVCTHNALSMLEDSEGFLFPYIDESKCVSCGLCQKVCPYNSDRSNNLDFLQECLAVTSPYTDYAKKSATIGLSTMISEKMIEQGNVVFGVRLDERTWRASHVACYDKYDVEAIRNSKYIQSNTLNTFIETRELLNKGKKVLYFGTPCQIAGLKGFLIKKYSNLYTVDIICHGVYSYRLLRKEISYWEEKYKGKVSNFKFRSKRKYPWIYGGIINFDLIGPDGKIKHIERHGSCSPTYRCYAYSGDGHNYNLRESCYNCIFRSHQRYGDLTIGDAWVNMDKYGLFNHENLKNGISLLLVNSIKGIELYQSVSGKCYDTKISHDDAFSQAALLETHREIPPIRKKIYENLDKKEYGSLIENLLHVNFTVAYYLFHYKHIKTIVKEKMLCKD